MPSPNLTALEYEVYRSKQAAANAQSMYEQSIKALAEGNATIARRAARGEEEPDTDEEDAEEDDGKSVESIPEIGAPPTDYMSAKEAARLTKIYKNPKKVLAAWKRVLKEGLRHNISSILNECRDYFMEDDAIDGMTPKQVHAVIKDWPAFCNELFASLKKDGSLISGDEHIFDNFEDTAGGCDEILQNKAIAFIQKKGKTM